MVKFTKMVNSINGNGNKNDHHGGGLQGAIMDGQQVKNGPTY
jgi:hypothetical protein